MIDIKKFERTVIDDVKPHLIITYLNMNSLNLIPKEVNWLIIEKLFYLMDNVMTMYQDINKIYWCQLYIVKMITWILKEELDLLVYGVSPLIISDIDLLIYSRNDIKINKPDMTKPIHMSEALTAIIEEKITSPNIYTNLNHMLVDILKSNEKYLACLNITKTKLGPI